jgi:hypothetical protein
MYCIPQTVYVAFSTTRPVVSSMASGLPPVLYVITGVPRAIDSMFVVGKLSK